MKPFISTFPRNVAQCFSKYNLRWHLLSIAITYVCVITGFDWLYFISARDPILNAILFPAIILGAILPFIIPVCAIVIGVMRKDHSLQITGWALGQAALIGSIISSIYKAFTGRTPPSFFNTTSDITGYFHFGYLKQGIFWGWPSSHTTIAFAMAVCLIYLYPEIKKLKYGALVYAFYIGIGVSISIHWFSDFAAGAILGTVIGVVVGKAFKSRLS
jgi:membrane-associated phospholipid phosphatase